MTKEQAVEKIKKLLALAMDKGAAEGEARNAMAMAEKIAQKYGLRIEKKEKLEQFTVIPFVLKVPSYKKFILEAMFEAMGMNAGYDNKQKTVMFWAASTFDTEKFLKVYKHFRSIYRKSFKEEKNNYFYWDRDLTKAFNKDFKNWVRNNTKQWY